MHTRNTERAPPSGGADTIDNSRTVSVGSQLLVKQELWIPDDPDKFMKIFRKLCEDYADENDIDGSDGSHQNDLLSFCHAYAYKVNGIEPWS
jgi:hypothetical protein